MMRLFTALELPAPVRAELTATQERLRAGGHPVRWADSAGLHLTLQFLGEADEARVAPLVARLAAIPAVTLGLELGPLGAFPNARPPRVIWVGLGGETTALARIQAQVVVATAPEGFTPEPRAFTPHLTLGRARQEATAEQLRALGEALARAEPPAMCLDCQTAPPLPEHRHGTRRRLHTAGAVACVRSPKPDGAAVLRQRRHRSSAASGQFGRWKKNGIMTPGSRRAGDRDTRCRAAGAAWSYGSARMTAFQLIGVPFDLHRPAVRMGATPAALLPRLAALPLPWVGEPILLAPSGLTGEPAADLATIAATLATAVRRARAVGALPVVIGGDCLTAIGTLGGLDGAAAGVVWIDAHGDFNTPATTPSGYLGGMPLAALAGRCLPALTAAAGLRAPVPAARIALLGARDLDPPEHAALAASQVAVLTSAQLRDEAGVLPQILARLGGQGPVYVHIDVDVLDPAVMPGVAYPAPVGLSLAELEVLLRAVRAHCAPAAITLTAVNVTAGNTEIILATAARVVQAALGTGDGR